MVAKVLLEAKEALEELNLEKILAVYAENAVFEDILSRGENDGSKPA